MISHHHHLPSPSVPRSPSGSALARTSSKSTFSHVLSTLHHERRGKALCIPPQHLSSRPSTHLIATLETYLRCTSCRATVVVLLYVYLVYLKTSTHYQVLLYLHQGHQERFKHAPGTDTDVHHCTPMYTTIHQHINQHVHQYIPPTNNTA